MTALTWIIGVATAAAVIIFVARFALGRMLEGDEDIDGWWN